MIRDGSGLSSSLGEYSEYDLGYVWRQFGKCNKICRMISNGNNTATKLNF